MNRRDFVKTGVAAIASAIEGAPAVSPIERSNGTAAGTATGNNMANEAARNPGGEPNYAIIDEGYGFELIWRPRQANDWPLEFLIQRSQGDDRPRGGPWAFNWVARRNPCFLVSGDLPRFALARTFPSPTFNPPIAKLGDLRIRVCIGSKSFWLDEEGKVSTRFYPWGTVHRVSLHPQVPLSLEVLATLMDNRGIAVRVSLDTEAANSLEGELDLVFGGLGFHETKFQVAVPYLQAHPGDQSDDTISFERSSAVIADPKIPVKVCAVSDSSGAVEIKRSQEEKGTGRSVVFRHRFTTDHTNHVFRFLAYQAEDGQIQHLRADRFEEYIQRTQRYYASMLGLMEIHTPDEVLNAAFYAAAVNLDYVYQPPAWLEGVHKWNAYFVNNYQISAAVCLGQLERARRALLFFAARPGGPGQAINADGSPIKSIANVQFEGGLPYFILQLYRYWLATGDREILDRVWEPTVKNLERMLQVRDPEGNLLLNWHLGANMFLYQADHLSLPGDACSPSLMVADNLEKMAEMAELRGEYARAFGWRNRAAYMRDEIVRRLWSPEEGKFLAAIDPQALRLRANYYTDFIFPQLYSKLPFEYSWISLKTLDRTLWVGDAFMRVGNYLPPLFGNNNVMPVQMAEASEAYFRAGRPGEGWRLLHGTARGATTHTDSPGSFPERMSDSGHGQPDFLFSNPAAAYIRAVVSGLFGIERTATMKALLWRPCVPEGWEAVDLRVVGMSVSISGRHGDRKYTVTLEKAQPLDARIPLLGHQVDKVRNSSGHTLPFTLMPHPSGGFIQICLEPATRHEFHVVSHSEEIGLKIPYRVEPGLKVKWGLPAPNMKVSDPQRAFDQFRVGGSTLEGKLGKAVGYRTIFLRNPQNGAVFPVDLHLGSAEEPRHGPLVLPGGREHLNLEERFNSERILAQNFWRHEPVKVDFSNYLVVLDGKSFFRLGEYVFRVRPSGKNMIVLSIGDLHPYTQKLGLSDKPCTIRFDVGQPVRGLEFLMTSEMKVRLTAMEVGCIRLRYQAGEPQIEPLVYGRNVDCLTKPFASQVATFKVDEFVHVSAFALTADQSRILESIELGLYATDASLAIFAINLIRP